MDVSLLIGTILGLVIVLTVLMFILLKPKKQKKVKKSTISPSKKTEKKEDLESLRQIIKNKNSTKEQLTYAVDQVLKNYGKIPEKMGVRLHPKFDIYSEMLVTLCRHSNTSKNIILKFDKELAKMNTGYKSELNDALSKGLNSRL